MLTLFCHLPRRSLAVCCGVLWQVRTITRKTLVTRIQLWKAESSHDRHYLRCLQSVICHHYKDLASYEAGAFVSNFPGLKGVAKTQLDHILALIKGDGHCWEKVKLYKEVLLLSPAQYRQRVQLLQSLSLLQPSLYHVLRISTVMCCPMRSFRNSKLTFSSDPLGCLLVAGRSELELSEFSLQGVQDLSCRDEKVTLKEVFFYMIKDYLAFRFSVDTDSVGTFLDSLHISSVWKPLSEYPKICDAINDYLKFSFSEMQEQPLLLHLDPENTKQIVHRFPSIGGTSTRELVKAHPELLWVPVSHLGHWLKLFHKHQVYKFTYTHHTTLMFKTSSFSEVGKRLQTLKGLQEWEIIVASDKLFDILRGQGSIKKLLNITESGQAVHSLSSVIEAKKVNKVKQWHKVTPEVVSYVASTLGLPQDEIRELLTEEICTQFGISNTKAVLRLLLDYGFTREQVVAGAMVLNLEAGVVEQALRDLHTRPEAQPFAEWMENPFVLQLLIYCIKKDIPHLDLPTRKSRLLHPSL